MIEVTLSDHATEQVNSMAATRNAEYEAAKQRFQAAVKVREQKGIALRQASREMFSSGKIGSWLMSLLRRFAHAFSAYPSCPRPPAISQQETVWNAGSEGERRVSEVLQQVLSEDWMVVNGYKNSGGEIDKLLIGPAGILAMEIKNVNGKVSCVGDSWWRDKYDKYGNLVESRLPIADKRGRGPSAQVNAAADRLQAFLAKRSGIQWVSRAVIFSHPSASIEQLQGLTVEMAGTLAALNTRNLGIVIQGGLAGNSVEQVVALIRKDHEFNANPRRSSPQGRGAGARKLSKQARDQGSSASHAGR